MSVADVLTMECDTPVHRSGIADNIKRLNIVGVVMFHADYATTANVGIVHPRDRIFEVALVNPVAFFGHDTGYAIPEPSESVADESCLI